MIKFTGRTKSFALIMIMVCASLLVGWGLSVPMGIVGFAVGSVSAYLFQCLILTKLNLVGQK